MGNINGKFANKKFYFNCEKNDQLKGYSKELLDKLDKEYPNGVSFTKDGRPIFPGPRINLWFKYQGNSKDYRVKDEYCKKHGLDPAKYTAEHLSHSTKIVVVCRDVHNLIKHTGGASDCRFICSLPESLVGQPVAFWQDLWYKHVRFIQYKALVNRAYIWPLIVLLGVYIASVFLILGDLMFSIFPQKKNTLFKKIRSDFSISISDEVIKVGFCFLSLILLIGLFLNLKVGNIFNSLPDNEKIVKAKNEVIGQIKPTNIKKESLCNSILTDKIKFRKASSELNKFNLNELNNIVKLLATNDNKILIEGHASSEGGKNFNQWISLQRAYIVKEYLLENGISNKRIEVKACGSNVPKATNETEEGRRINRRVTIKE